MRIFSPMAAGALCLVPLLLGIASLFNPPSISSESEARIETRVLCTQWISKTAWEGKTQAEIDPAKLSEGDEKIFKELVALYDRLPKNSMERAWIGHMGRIAPANEATALHVPSSPPPEWLILLVQAHQLDGGPAVRSQARQALWKQLRPWYYFGNVLLVFSIIGLILWLFRRRIWSKTPFQSTSCAPISPTDVLGVIGIWVLFRLTWSIFVPVLSKNHPTATLIVEYLPQVLVGFAAINYLLLRCGCSWSALGVTPPGNKKTITKWGLWGCCGIAMALPLVFTVQWLNQFVVNMTDPVFPIVLGIMEEGHLFWLIVITTIVAPIFEEIMFRGLLYGSLRTLYSARTANIIQAFGFALLHFSPSTFLPLWVLGLVLGRLREQFSDLAPAIITHALWNGLVLMVFHFYLRV